MMHKRFEVKISDLTQKTYTLSYFPDTGVVRLIEYQELRRESTRKRKYEVVRWYNWHNHRDRTDPRWINVEEVELPQSVKQAFIHDLIEGLTFITTERK